MLKHRNAQKRIYFKDAVYFIACKTKDNFPYFKERIFCEVFLENLRICESLKQKINSSKKPPTQTSSHSPNSNGKNPITTITSVTSVISKTISTISNIILKNMDYLTIGFIFSRIRSMTIWSIIFKCIMINLK